MFIIDTGVDSEMTDFFLKATTNDVWSSSDMGRSWKPLVIDKVIIDRVRIPHINGWTSNMSGNRKGFSLVSAGAKLFLLGGQLEAGLLANHDF